ncbi:hypothetical protein M5689_020579 [Euphorbia peplus]|nr:hypothetical protein M5689_020579 [Euphorbia peplus]
MCPESLLAGAASEEEAGEPGPDETVGEEAAICGAVGVLGLGTCVVVGVGWSSGDICDVPAVEAEPGGSKLSRRGRKNAPDVNLSDVLTSRELSSGIVISGVGSKAREGSWIPKVFLKAIESNGNSCSSRNT